ncbi:MAG: IS110 family transposase [Chitinophagales bacterium]
MNDLVIGIDVSCATLDIAYKVQNQWVDLQIENTVEAIECFLKDFNSQTTQFVLEPTGTYSDKLICTLDRLRYTLKLLNPQKSSAFMQVLGITSKDDKQSARALAIAGKTLDLVDYQMPKEAIKKRKQLQMVLNALEKQQRQIKNQIHSLEQYHTIHELALNALQKVLETLEQNIQKIENEFKAITDIAFDRFKKLACSVIGIGAKSAHLLYIYTNGFEIFAKDKQLLKFVGTVPATQQSGSSVYKRGHITKAGPASIRATLYNATKSAVRFNKECKELFERLRTKGKPHKVARVAVINKLLRQTFAVVKSGVKFDNDYQRKIKEQIQNNQQLKK